MLSIWAYCILVFTIISHIPLFRLASNLSDVVTWHFFFIPFLVFVLSSIRWWKRPPRNLHSLTLIHEWWLGGIIRGAHTLASHKHLESIPNPTPLPSTRLCHTWALVHVKEDVWIVHALTLSTLATPPDETTWVLCLFHPPIEVDIPLFYDFHLETKVILNWKAFVSALVCSPLFLLVAFRVWCMNFYNIVLS